MGTKVLAAIVLILLFAATEAHAERSCRIPYFDFNIASEGPWPARMTVKSGKTCGTRHWSFGRTTPSRLYLVTQAKHGTVTLSHPGGYHYSPASGYVGSDSFTLRICGTRDGSYKGCANLLFDVSVVTQVN